MSISDYLDMEDDSEYDYDYGFYGEEGESGDGEDDDDDDDGEEDDFKLYDHDLFPDPAENRHDYETEASYIDGYDGEVNIPPGGSGSDENDGVCEGDDDDEDDDGTYLWPCYR